MVLSDSKKQIISAVLLFIFCSSLLPAQAVGLAFDVGRKQLDDFLTRASFKTDEQEWRSIAQKGIEAAMCAWEQNALEENEDILSKKESVRASFEAISNERLNEWKLSKTFSQKSSEFIQRLKEELGEKRETWKLSGSEISGELTLWQKQSEEFTLNKINDFLTENTLHETQAAQMLRSEANALCLAEQNALAKSILAQNKKTVSASDAKTAREIAEEISASIAEETTGDLLSLSQKLHESIEKNQDDDIMLTQKDWLEEFKQVLDSGLSKWEKAEKEFLENRIQWEAYAEQTYNEGFMQWSNALNELSKRKKEWEEQTEIQIQSVLATLSEKENEMKKDISRELSEYAAYLMQDYTRTEELINLYTENYESYRSLMQSDMETVRFEYSAWEEQIEVAVALYGDKDFSFTIKPYFSGESDIENTISKIDSISAFLKEYNSADAADEEKLRLYRSKDALLNSLGTMRLSLTELKDHMKKADEFLSLLNAQCAAESGTNVHVSLENQIAAAETEYTFLKNEYDIATKIFDEVSKINFGEESIAQLKENLIAAQESYKKNSEEYEKKSSALSTFKDGELNDAKLEVEKAKDTLSLAEQKLYEAQKEYSIMLSSCNLTDTESIKNSLASLVKNGYSAVEKSAVENNFFAELNSLSIQENSELLRNAQRLSLSLKGEAEEDASYALTPLSVLERIQALTLDEILKSDFDMEYLTESIGQIATDLLLDLEQKIGEYISQDEPSQEDADTLEHSLSNLKSFFHDDLMQRKTALALLGGEELSEEMEAYKSQVESLYGSFIPEVVRKNEENARKKIAELIYQMNTAQGESRWNILLEMLSEENSLSLEARSALSLYTSELIKVWADEEDAAPVDTALLREKILLLQNELEKINESYNLLSTLCFDDGGEALEEAKRELEASKERCIAELTQCALMQEYESLRGAKESTALTEEKKYLLSLGDSYTISNGKENKNSFLGIFESFFTNEALPTLDEPLGESTISTHELLSLDYNAWLSWVSSVKEYTGVLKNSLSSESEKKSMLSQAKNKVSEAEVKIQEAHDVYKNAVDDYSATAKKYEVLLTDANESYKNMLLSHDDLRVKDEVFRYANADYLHIKSEGITADCYRTYAEKMEEAELAMENAAAFLNSLNEQKTKLLEVMPNLLEVERENLLAQAGEMQQVLVLEYAANETIASQRLRVMESEAALGNAIQNIFGETEVEGREEMLLWLTEKKQSPQEFKKIILASLYEEMISDSSNTNAFAGQELTFLGGTAGTFNATERYISRRKTYLKNAYDEVISSEKLRADLERYKTYDEKFLSYYGTSLRDWALDELYVQTVAGIYSEMNSEYNSRQETIKDLAIGYAAYVVLGFLNPFALAIAAGLLTSIGVEEAVSNKIMNFITEFRSTYENRNERSLARKDGAVNPIEAYTDALALFEKESNILAALEGEGEENAAVLTKESFVSQIKDNLKYTAFDEGIIQSLEDDFVLASQNGKTFTTLEKALSAIGKIREERLNLSMSDFYSKTESPIYEELVRQLLNDMANESLSWKYFNILSDSNSLYSDSTCKDALSEIEQKALLHAQDVNDNLYLKRQAELESALSQFQIQRDDFLAQIAQMKLVAKNEWKSAFEKMDVEFNSWNDEFVRKIEEKRGVWEGQYTAFLSEKQEWLYRQYVYAENAGSYDLMEKSGLSPDEEILASLSEMEKNILFDADLDTVAKNTEEYVKALCDFDTLSHINNSLSLIGSAAGSMNTYVGNADMLGSASSQAIAKALEGQKEISSAMRTNAARLAATQAQERITQMALGLEERLDAENAAQENFFLALYENAGYNLGTDMSRTITTGSSLAQTKRETQIVERYRRFEAPERPDGGVSISHTDAEEILMHKTSEALERLRLWEEGIFGETVAGADGRLGVRERTVARTVADAAAGGNTGAYEGAEEKLLRAKERAEELSEKLKSGNHSPEEINEIIQELSTLDTDEVKVRDGAFGEYLGYGSVFSATPDISRGMEANIARKGRGEAGRLIDSYQWNETVHAAGMGEMNKALYDQKLWLGEGIIDAPTLRDIASIGTGILSAATGGTLAPLLGLCDDALFALLDGSLGYKDWQTAALELGKSAVGTAVSMGTGALSSALNGAVIGLDAAQYSGLDRLIFQTEIAMGTGALGTAANALVGAVQYDPLGGWSYDLGTAADSIFSAQGLAGILSAGASTLVGGGISLGFDQTQRKFLGGAASLAGTGAGVAADLLVHTAANGWNLARGYDSMGGITLNLLDAGAALDFIGSTIARSNSTGQAGTYGLSQRLRGVGLLELNIGSGGVSGRIGGGGINVAGSFYDLTKRGLDAAALSLYQGTKGEALGQAAWNAYVYGDWTAENTAARLAAGLDSLVFTDEEDFTARTVSDGRGRTITMRDGGSAAANAIQLQHEAYRDGIIGSKDEQNAETLRAATAHTEMALRLADILGGDVALLKNLAVDILSYSLGEDAFREYVENNYDSYDDFWKLTWGGQLINDGQGWLVNEKGEYINIDGTKSPVPIAGKTLGAGAIDKNGEAIKGSVGFIETGLLNIIANTSGKSYSSFTDEEVKAAQSLIMKAGIEAINTNEDFRKLSWTAQKGQKIDMTDFLETAGAGVSKVIVDRYYNNSVDSQISKIFGVDLGFNTDKAVPKSQYLNYFNVLTNHLVDFISTGNPRQALKDKYFQTFTNEARETTTLYRIDENNPFIDSLLGQHDFKEINSVIDKEGCNFMSILAVPQLLTGNIFKDKNAVQEIWDDAVKGGYVKADDATVNFRYRILDLASERTSLADKDIHLSLSDKTYKGYNTSVIARRIGWINEKGNIYHFSVGDLNNSAIYNPGYTVLPEYSTVDFDIWWR